MFLLFFLSNLQTPLPVEIRASVVNIYDSVAKFVKFVTYLQYMGTRGGRIIERRIWESDNGFHLHNIKTLSQYVSTRT
jgi:hypothetical protein